jgi:Na+/proline symporter
MLLWFVIIYWIISVAIGIYAAKWVHNTKDFAVAGRRMPMYIVTATVFATWFGSETVLGIPATFMKEGFAGTVADPFGSSLCLILVGLFFARPLYRMNLLTIGDYYRKRYSRPVEMLTSLCIVISYLGWVGAQIKALGLVFNVVSDGMITQQWGMVIGASTVLVYTLLGGMFSVAITDFIQMIIIVLGMAYIGWEVSGLVPGGASAVISHAASSGKFNILPAPELKDILWFFTAWITMMLGSIPQQDVFQRVQSAKDENTAANSSILGGALYFCFAFVPMFLAYSASLIDPKMVEAALKDGGDTQQILPSLILSPIVPVFAQIMFFGALLSAIKSCASATLLAPFGELQRERPQALLQGHGRPAVPEAHAHRARRLHLHGHLLRAQLRREHLQDGGERVQGDAGRRLRAARVRPLLEARDQPGRGPFGDVGTHRVDLLRVLLHGRHGAPAARRARRELRRDDRRLARVAQPAAHGDHLICSSPS